MNRLPNPYYGPSTILLLIVLVGLLLSFGGCAMLRPPIEHPAPRGAYPTAITQPVR